MPQIFSMIEEENDEGNSPTSTAAAKDQTYFSMDSDGDETLAASQCQEATPSLWVKSANGDWQIFGIDGNLVTAYLSSISAGAMVYQTYSDFGMGTLITLASAIQCFAYMCLCLKVAQTKSVAGISGQTLILQALSYTLRLSSTLWLPAYVPVDETGEWIYQLTEVIALLLVTKIMYNVFLSRRATYQEEHEIFKARPIAIGCFVLAALVHPDLNSRPLFDTLWATALYIDMVAMLPQLGMIARMGGEVEALTGHFSAAMAVSTIIELAFWCHGFEEVAPLDGSSNIQGWMIVLVHIVQLLLMCDFLIYYIRALILTGRPRVSM